MNRQRIILWLLVALAHVAAVLLLLQRETGGSDVGAARTPAPAPVVVGGVPAPPAVTNPTPTPEDLSRELTRELVRPDAAREPAPGPNPTPDAGTELAEPARQVERGGGCEAAIATVTSVAGMPPGWTITCDPRDTRYRGQADIGSDRITIFWNESQREYELTVAHELGHAWDSWGLANRWQQEKPTREAWVGHALTNAEWTSWYSLYAEAYAEHLAAGWGWYGAGH